MEWWGDLYEQCYAEGDSILSEESLEKDLIDLEDMFNKREHMAYVEMLPLLKMSNGLRVLEIGPGGRGHAALFARHGAHMTTLDITPSRAVSTALKLSHVGDKEGFSCQGDSETYLVLIIHLILSIRMVYFTIPLVLKKLLMRYIVS